MSVKKQFEVVNDRTEAIRQFNNEKDAVIYARAGLGDGYSVYEVLPNEPNDRLIEHCVICDSDDERVLEGIGRR